MQLLQLALLGAAVFVCFNAGTADAACEPLCVSTATCGVGDVCVCNAGYTGDGATCTTVNECTTGAHSCTSGYTCTDTVGSFSCTNINECSANTHNCAASNAACTNTAGSFTCACNTGYVGSGIVCADRNECTLGIDNCADGATCTNIVGSFECDCNTGYSDESGNAGTTCDDIDECDEDDDNCNLHATCANTAGSFTCACNAGYTGTGVACLDINECAAGTDDCHNHATCTNTAGDFTCACNTGYTGSGISCTSTATTTAPAGTGSTTILHDDTVTQVVHLSASRVSSVQLINEAFELNSSTWTLLRINHNVVEHLTRTGYLTIEGITCTTTSTDPVGIWTQLVHRAEDELGTALRNAARETYTQGVISTGEDGEAIHLRALFRPTALTVPLWMMVRSSFKLTCNPPTSTDWKFGGSVSHIETCGSEHTGRVLAGDTTTLTRTASTRLFAHYGRPPTRAWNTVQVNLDIRATVAGNYTLYMQLNSACSDNTLTTTTTTSATTPTTATTEEPTTTTSRRHGCVPTYSCTTNFGFMRAHIAVADRWVQKSVSFVATLPEFEDETFSLNPLALEVILVSGGTSVQINTSNINVVEFIDVGLTPAPVLRLFYHSGVDSSETDSGGRFIGADAEETAQIAATGFVFKSYAYFNLASALVVGAQDMAMVNFRMLSTTDTVRHLSIYFLTLHNNVTDPHAVSCGAVSRHNCLHGFDVRVNITTDKWTTYNVEVPKNTVADWSTIRWVAIIDSTASHALRRTIVDDQVSIGTVGDLVSTQARPPAKDSSADMTTIAIVSSVCVTLAVVAFIAGILISSRRQSYAAVPTASS